MYYSRSEVSCWIDGITCILASVGVFLLLKPKEQKEMGEKIKAALKTPVGSEKRKQAMKERQTPLYSESFWA